MLVVSVVAAWLPVIRAASPAAKRHFQISSGDAARTLRQLAESSGIQIVYVLPRVKGVMTNPVDGDYTPREALDLMVERTELVVIEDKESGALTINRIPRKPPPSAPPSQTSHSTPKNMNPIKPNTLARFIALVLGIGQSLSGQSTAPVQPSETNKNSSGEVQELSAFIVNASKDEGYYSAQTTMGSRTAKDLLEVPATILIAPRELIDDLNAQMGKDVLPFIAPGVYSNTDFNEDATIRGFRVGGSLRDGLSYPGIKTTKLYDVERVEVLMGPGAMLLGNNDYIGGNVNYITRRPTDYQTGSVDLSLYEHSHYRATINTSGPAYKSDNLGVSYRVTLGREGGGTAKPIVNFDDTFYGAGFEFRVGRATVIDFFGSYYEDRSYNYYNDFLDVSSYGPGLEPRLNQYSTESFSTTAVSGQAHRNERAATMNLRLVSQLNDNIDVRVALGSVANHTIERIIRGTGTIANNYMLNRQDIMQAPVDRGQTDAQIDFNHDLETKHFRLESTVGAQASKYTTDEWLDLSPTGSLAPLDTRNPNYSGDAAYFAVNTDAKRTGHLFRKRPAEYSSAYFQENLHLLNDRLILIGGLRWFSAESHRVTQNPATAAPVISNQTDENYRPYKTGVVFRVTPGLSVYFTDAANVYPQAGNVDKFMFGDRLGDPLPNREGKDTEVGLKANTRIGSSVAVYGNVVYYDMELTNVPTDGILPNGNPGTVLSTSQTAKGVELSGGARFQFSPGTATVGVTYSDATSTTASRPGQAAEFVPRSYSVIAKFVWSQGPLNGLTVGATMYDQSGKLGNVLEVVDWPVTYNAFASYRVGKHWSGQLNLTNFTNERYIVKVASAALVSAKRGFEPSIGVRYRW